MEPALLEQCEKAQDLAPFLAQVRISVLVTWSTHLMSRMRRLLQVKGIEPLFLAIQLSTLADTTLNKLSAEFMDIKES